MPASPNSPLRTEATDGPWYARFALALIKQPNAAPLLLPVALSGLLGWVFHHGVTVTIPEMQRASHEQLKEERNVFRTELRLQRDHDRRQTAEIVHYLGSLADEVRQIKLHGAATKP